MQRCHDSTIARVSFNPAMQKNRGVAVQTMKPVLAFDLRAGTTLIAIANEHNANAEIGVACRLPPLALESLDNRPHCRV
jgi:hypothetical protein